MTFLTAALLVASLGGFAAPDEFRVRLETSKGIIVVEVHRAWAPHGADRFYDLVQQGFYDEARFFRVVAGRWAQVGIHADSKIATLWRNRTIPDDPRRESNVRGTVAFAFAEPNGRTTQIFINLRDNSDPLDAQGFAPFGRVVEGMDVADALNAEYGESAGGGIRAGKQDPLFRGGNAYLAREFPRLDFIRRATVLSPDHQITKSPHHHILLGIMRAGCAAGVFRNTCRWARSLRPRPGPSCG